MAGAIGLPEGSGAIVEIDLTVSGNAEVGTETTLRFSEASMYDESGQVILVVLEDGVVRITQPGIKSNLD